MFNFCPSCASKNITFNEGKLFRCPDCNFTFYHNIAAATGCLITVPSNESVSHIEKPIVSRKTKWSEKFVFLIRGKEPAIGKLDLPGGFIDIGEGVIEGLFRELKEELNWTPPIPEGLSLTGIFKLFASFSNVYHYKGINYNTCDMYFHISAPGLKPEDLRLEKSEIAGVLFLKPEDIDFSTFAFQSTVKAVKTYLELPLN